MRSLATLLALSALTGCAGPESWEGIWFIQMPVIDATACTDDVDENYIDAFVPNGEDPDALWTYTDVTTLSDSAFFAQVLEGDGDSVFVVIEDQIYPGTADKNLLQVSWTGVEDDLSEQVHETGYRFLTQTVADYEETLTLMRGEDGNVTGHYSIVSNSVTSWTETDRWKMDKVGIYDSQTPSYSYLGGEGILNMPDTEECNGDDCELTVSSDCAGEIDFTGQYAGLHEEGMYAGIEDANRDPGAGSSEQYEY